MRARRLAYCRRCGEETRQTFVAAVQEGVETWRCSKGCGITTLGNVDDIEGFAEATVELWLDKVGFRGGDHVRGLERADAYAEALTAVWVAFTKWDYKRNPSFASFASWKVGNALTDWLRSQRGRTVKNGVRNPNALKPHAAALSLDAPHRDGDTDLVDLLERAISEGSPHFEVHRSPDLTRALSGRDRAALREERGVGSGADA